MPAIEAILHVNHKDASDRSTIECMVDRKIVSSVAFNRKRGATEGVVS